ncbi:hypothetical protein NDU88_007510 [Pleurodeles waltl]|uniref:Uncharacterized protein n=1 Tax=Pleurodeles waltl TaxID=8319 RepID=A0AAV7PQG9_PLEWA|nr:hypothetical protein NDU88_007510 [Pleurodeles waltl]
MKSASQGDHLGVDQEGLYNKESQNSNGSTMVNQALTPPSVRQDPATSTKEYPLFHSPTMVLGNKDKGKSSVVLTSAAEPLDISGTLNNAAEKTVRSGACIRGSASSSPSHLPVQSVDLVVAQQQSEVDTDVIGAAVRDVAVLFADSLTCGMKDVRRDKQWRWICMEGIMQGLDVNFVNYYGPVSDDT